MKKDEPPIRTIQSISELHRLLHLPKPAHPLVSVLHLEQVTQTLQTTDERVIYPFY